MSTCKIRKKLKCRFSVRVFYLHHDFTRMQRWSFGLLSLVLASRINGVETTAGLKTMAWRCTGRNNMELVTNLEKAGIFTSPRVREAMLAVDRGDFSPREPYHDSPQGIGYGATISAPHMHAAALEGLKDQITDGAKVLDVGSGSGYLTACLALMAGPRGKVVGIDHIKELKELADKNIAKNHMDLVRDKRILFIEGDGRKGYPPDGPYNAIHVGAAAEKVPKELTDQLAEGGRMLIPVGKESGDQVFLQVDKINGQIQQKVIEHVIYVPLTDREHQLRRGY